jgi:hypothetical protein
MNVVPFFEAGVQKYYTTWSSSSGSNDGWQHDIYRQIISFTSEGEINFNTSAHRYIGTGFDEAQEPVKIAIDPRDNTMLSVWEDGSGSSVDIHGQLHQPDGTIIRSNWIIAGGTESQHSPDVVHLDGLYLVSLTDEAPPADYAMNEVRILDEKTGDQIGSLDLTPKAEDYWWTVAASDNRNFAFVGWGNDDDFFGSVIKASSGTITKTDAKLFVPNIEQYYYSVAWLENLSNFIAIVKSNRNSIACLIDTNGVKTASVSIPNAPITRETDIAVRWDEPEEKYQILYTAASRDIALLSVSTHTINLEQLCQDSLTATNWPTTGIACQFIHSTGGTDLWDSVKKILIVHNDENSNAASYHFLTIKEGGDTIDPNCKSGPEKLALFPAYPNPFNLTTSIHYAIGSEEFVKIQVYNLQGQEVQTLVNKKMQPGNYTVTFKANAISSGIYIFRMRTNTKVISRKMLLLQ